MTLYVVITADKYELPLAVRDTQDEIEQLLGRSGEDVSSMISRKTTSMTRFNGFRYRIVRVNVDDEEDDSGQD